MTHTVTVLIIILCVSHTAGCGVPDTTPAPENNVLFLLFLPPKPRSASSMRIPIQKTAWNPEVNISPSSRKPDYLSWGMNQWELFLPTKKHHHQLQAATSSSTSASPSAPDSRDFISWTMFLVTRLFLQSSSEIKLKLLFKLIIFRFLPSIRQHWEYL